MIMIGKNTLVFTVLCAVTLQHLDAAPQYRFRPQWRYDEIELHYNNPSPYKTGEFDPLNINQDYGSRVYQPPYAPAEVDSNENNLDNDIAHGFSSNESPAIIPAAFPERVDEQQMENDTPVANPALIPEPIFEEIVVDVDGQKDPMEENAFDNAPIVAPAAIVPELALQGDESSAGITFSEEDTIAHEFDKNDRRAVVLATLPERVNDQQMKSDTPIAVPAHVPEPVYEQEAADVYQQKDAMEEKNFDNILVAAPAAIVPELAIEEDESSAGTIFSEEDNIAFAFNTNDSPVVMPATLPGPVDEQQVENDTPIAVLALVPEPVNEQEEANADRHRDTMQTNSLDDIPVGAPAAIVAELDIQEDKPSFRTTFSEEDDSEESQEIFPFAIFQQSSEDSNEVAADDVARSAIIANKEEIEEAEAKSNIAVAAEINNSIKLTETENDEHQVDDAADNIKSSPDIEKVFEPIGEARLAESQTEISFDEGSINEFDATEPSNVVSQVNLDESNKDFDINNLEEGAEKISDLSSINHAQINIKNADSSSDIAEDTTEADENLLMKSSIKNIDAEPEVNVNQDEIAGDETSGDNDFTAKEAGSFTPDAILADQGSGDNSIALDAVENVEDFTELSDTIFRMENIQQLSSDDATETTVLLSRDAAEFEFNPININADDGAENATEAV